jgi:hypothetical protein
MRSDIAWRKRSAIRCSSSTQVFEKVSLPHAEELAARKARQVLSRYGSCIQDLDFEL